MNESSIVELRKRAGADEFTCPAVLCNDGEYVVSIGIACCSVV